MQQERGQQKEELALGALGQGPQLSQGRLGPGLARVPLASDSLPLTLTSTHCLCFSNTPCPGKGGGRVLNLIRKAATKKAASAKHPPPAYRPRPSILRSFMLLSQGGRSLSAWWHLFSRAEVSEAGWVAGRSLWSSAGRRPRQGRQPRGVSGDGADEVGVHPHPQVRLPGSLCRGKQQLRLSSATPPLAPNLVGHPREPRRTGGGAPSPRCFIPSFSGKAGAPGEAQRHSVPPRLPRASEREGRRASARPPAAWSSCAVGRASSATGERGG